LPLHESRSARKYRAHRLPERFEHGFTFSLDTMHMGCAECGGIIESGWRIIVCSDTCCCRDMPAKADDAPAEAAGEDGPC
jgi:hypothetical protein